MKERKCSMTETNVVPFNSALPKIEILNTRANCKADSVIVAYVDVAIGLITIYGISVGKNKNGPGYWVGLPNNYGKTGKSFHVVSIKEPLYGDLCRAVLDACRQYGVS
jgi:hypothetical protein